MQLNNVTKLIALILFTTSLYSQTEPSKVSISPITHFIGVDVGYSNYFKFVNYKGEVNLNYVFNPHTFCIKAQVGIAPSTNFGTLTKTFLSIGFSTKTSKPFSWHFLTGFGKIFTSKDYVRPITLNGVKVGESTYHLEAFNGYIESGFYFNLFKARNKIIGLNFTFMPISSYQYDNYKYYDKIISYNINLSFNIKLNK